MTWATRESEPHPHAASRPMARLLVIDDDPVQGAIISSLSPKAGYVADIANSVDEAERKIRATSYDLITLDLSLGEHSGTQLLRVIAANGATPVVVVSGCSERVLNSAVQLAAMLGVPSRRVAKPINPAELCRAMIETNAAIEPGEFDSPELPATDLASAIKSGAIDVRFQPRIELETGRIVGAEATPIWRRGEEGVSPATELTEMAKASGLSARLTEALLLAAARAAREIVEVNPDFRVSVDISAAWLDGGDISGAIPRALELSGLPARALSIEISEDAALSDVTRATELVVELAIKGVNVCIADFGARFEIAMRTSGARAFSSLASLARMPFSEMRLAPAFTRRSGADEDRENTALACVNYGHALKMRLIASGVTNPAHRAALAMLGFDVGQGPCLSPPMDPAAFQLWLRANPDGF